MSLRNSCPTTPASGTVLRSIQEFRRQKWRKPRKARFAGGRLVHPMNPERSGVEIRTIRGDCRDADGTTHNRLRLWEKSDFVPRPDDIYQERLYCIQWITEGARWTRAGRRLSLPPSPTTTSRESKDRGDCQTKSFALAGRGLCARHADRAGRRDNAPIPRTGLDAIGITCLALDRYFCYSVLFVTT